jgi:hypothetical protein
MNFNEDTSQGPVPMETNLTEHISNICNALGNGTEGQYMEPLFTRTNSIIGQSNGKKRKGNIQEVV